MEPFCFVDEAVTAAWFEESQVFRGVGLEKVATVRRKFGSLGLSFVFEGNVVPLIFPSRKSEAVAVLSNAGSLRVLWQQNQFFSKNLGKNYSSSCGPSLSERGTIAAARSDYSVAILDVALGRELERIEAPSFLEKKKPSCVALSKKANLLCVIYGFSELCVFFLEENRQDFFHLYEEEVAEDVDDPCAEVFFREQNDGEDFVVISSTKIQIYAKTDDDIKSRCLFKVQSPRNYFEKGAMGRDFVVAATRRRLFVVDIQGNHKSCLLNWETPDYRASAIAVSEFSVAACANTRGCLLFFNVNHLEPTRLVHYGLQRPLPAVAFSTCHPDYALVALTGSALPPWLAKQAADWPAVPLLRLARNVPNDASAAIVVKQNFFHDYYHNRHQNSNDDHQGRRLSSSLSD